jgi:2-polyprenyl-6-hydroxyphenyl methylase/3-demethylubiquinone-9 3-methyltransferase
VKLSRLKTQQVENSEDIKAFFDESAPDYAEKHGDSGELLANPLRLIRKTIHPSSNDIILDIGCGIGHYLLALANDIGHGIGIDFSAEMIASAKKRAADSPWQGKLTFKLDEAEQLSTIPDCAIDSIICVGALEHMVRKAVVLTSGYRVLKPGGQFMCLTPNANFLWYRFIAPLLNLDTKHLSTDAFLNGRNLKGLLQSTGYINTVVDYWTFIPTGDLSSSLSRLCRLLDKLGTFFLPDSLRSGLVVTAQKPGPL